MTRALDQVAAAARAARPALPTPAEIQDQMATPIGIGRILNEVLAETEQRPSRTFRVPEVIRRP